ncbi:hypothetical protein Patl1_11664 [Pistacia atlantica]|uniref:Uncharacterized protein n=1 Tax=Pistacia atlantica TaxID=434234 RepID=A0ACC1A6K7_9ROSI|nr:hypothetical protein Patl1_11664 [Pistacia atlantica]
MIGLGFSGLTVKVDQNPLPPNFQPQYLDLRVCHLGGTIPDFLANLTQLTLLDLAYNNLSGTIPPWLFNPPNLGSLDLSFNNPHGVLPPHIKLHSFYGPTTLNLVGVERLRYFCLSGSKLYGQIPFYFYHSDNVLMLLYLSNNNLEGTAPNSLGNYTSLIFLNVGGNKLNGEVSNELENEMNLSYLDLTDSHFEGPFPGFILDL